MHNKHNTVSVNSVAVSKLPNNGAQCADTSNPDWYQYIYRL